MQYRIGNVTIASELAAKSPTQTSAPLLAFLENYHTVGKTLDFGCGKLRYSAALAALSDSLTLVDSSRQLDRQQKICGRETTVRLLAQSLWPTIRIETIEDFQAKQRPKFDFVLCANVLSAIPSKAARSRALYSIKRRLKSEGSILVVNQHTNSYFTKLASRPTASRHLDGWLVVKNNFSSYYGILGKDKVAAILGAAGFSVYKHWIVGQSNYALARKK